MNKIDLTHLPEYIPQVLEIHQQCLAMLTDGETNHKKLKKAICQWSYEKRENENKDFVYLAVLNSGPAGETLASSPLKSQNKKANSFFDHTTLYVNFTEEDIHIELKYFNTDNKVHIILYDEHIKIKL